MNFKISILILALSVSFMALGQDEPQEESGNGKLYSKKGIYILPEKGDIVLGVDAYPFLYYLGGIFSQNHASVPYVDNATSFGDDAQIFIKYMLSENTAVRASFGGDFGSFTSIYAVPESNLTPDPLAPTYVTDEVTAMENALHIGVGIEKYRGKSRVQGKYGAELVFGYNKYNVSYNYGNSITNEFNTPTTFSDFDTYSGAQRILNDYVDKGMFVGLRGLLGVEYFIGPKISLGCEFGYSFVYQWAQNRITEYQYWNSIEQQVSTVIRETSDNGYNDYFLGLDHLDGSINIFFYF